MCRPTSMHLQDSNGWINSLNQSNECWGMSRIRISDKLVWFRFVIPSPKSFIYKKKESDLITSREDDIIHRCNLPSNMTPFSTNWSMSPAIITVPERMRFGRASRTTWCVHRVNSCSPGQRWFEKWRLRTFSRFRAWQDVISFDWPWGCVFR